MGEAATASGLVGSDAAVVASEVGRTGEDMASKSPGILAVVERTRRRSPLALLSRGSRSQCGGSRCSSGWMLRTQHQPFSRLTMLPRAWSGKILTSGSQL